MAVSLELPDVGAGPTGALIAEWYRPDGASVRAGEAVCRVESDFIAYELEATQPGVLRHQLPAGATGPVGTPLALILAPGESSESSPPAGPPAKRSASVAPGRVAGPVEQERKAAVGASETSEEEVVAPERKDRIEPGRVVLPFPRRFAKVPALEWDTVPGDAVEFSTALLGDEPEQVTEELEEPGGSIPGLPLWADDEEPPVGHAYPHASDEPAPSPVEASTEAVATAAPVAGLAPAAGAQILSVAVEVELTEAVRVAAAVGRALGHAPLEVRAEDVVFRGIGLALEDAGRGAAGLLALAGVHGDVATPLAAAKRPLREAVAARLAGGDAIASPDVRWALLSLAELGTKSATPKLEPPLEAAFSIGAANAGGQAIVTMAVDGAAWSASEAARLLARVRELVEAPYAMLV